MKAGTGCEKIVICSFAESKTAYFFVFVETPITIRFGKESQKMEMTLRWYGKQYDTVRLEQIRQIPGVKGVITTLYQKAPGDVWQPDEIKDFGQTAVHFPQPTHSSSQITGLPFSSLIALNGQAITQSP